MALFFCLVFWFWPGACAQQGGGERERLSPEGAPVRGGGAAGRAARSRRHRIRGGEKTAGGVQGERWTGFSEDGCHAPKREGCKKDRSAAKKNLGKGSCLGVPALCVLMGQCVCVCVCVCVFFFWHRPRANRLTNEATSVVAGKKKCSTLSNRYSLGDPRRISQKHTFPTPGWPPTILHFSLLGSFVSASRPCFALVGPF